MNFVQILQLVIIQTNKNNPKQIIPAEILSQLTIVVKYNLNFEIKCAYLPC